MDVEALLAATAAEGEFSPRGFNEETAHGFAGSAEKMRAVLEMRLVIFTNEAQPGLMNKSGGLKGLAWLFGRHFQACKFAEFCVDERKKIIRGGRVAAFDSGKEAGDVFVHDGLG